MQGKTNVLLLLGAVHVIMQAPDRSNVPPLAECKVGPSGPYRTDMRSTARKILSKGADAFPVGRQATK